MFRAASNFGFAGLYGQPYGLTAEERRALWAEDRSAGMRELTENNVNTQAQQDEIARIQSQSPTERGAVYVRLSDADKAKAINGAWIRLSLADRQALDKIARVYATDAERPAGTTSPALFLAGKIPSLPAMDSRYFAWINASTSLADRGEIMRYVGAAWRKSRGLAPVGGSTDLVVDDGGDVSSGLTTGQIVAGVAVLALVGGGIYYFTRGR